VIFFQPYTAVIHSAASCYCQTGAAICLSELKLLQQLTQWHGKSSMLRNSTADILRRTKGTMKFIIKLSEWINVANTIIIYHKL